MKLKYRLFSQRYKDILKNTSFITEFDGNIKVKLVDRLFYYNQEYVEQLNAYNSLTRNRSASDYVSEDISTAYGFRDGDDIVFDDEIMYRQEAYFIFDIIESWFFHNKDINLASDLNEIFEENELPWRIVNWQVIKIDSKQFEQDMILKHLQDLQEIQSVEPKFHSAYKELIEAKMQLSIENTKSSILSAAQSYESVMKVITGITDGQADKLIAAILKTELFNDFPKEMKIEGFKANVLSALPYIRNQTKVGHGEGGEKIVIPTSLARLAINLSCSLSSYLIELYKNSATYKEKLVKKQEDDLPDEWK